MAADTAAFRELVRVLEQAVQAGVTSIGIEYEDSDLIAYYRSGSLGVGKPIPRNLKQAFLEELVKKAGLARKPRGKMRVTLHGKEYEVVVEEFESFGESAFELTIGERKKKTGR